MSWGVQIWGKDPWGNALSVPAEPGYTGDNARQASVMEFRVGASACGSSLQLATR